MKAVLLIVASLLCIALRAQDSKDSTFHVVEEMPEFIGGTASLMQFIQKNIHYPDDAREMNIQGRLVIGFVIEANGNIDSVTAINPVWPSIDAEGIRVVKLTKGYWQPGTQQGKAVAVHFNLPLSMRLDGDDMAPLDNPNKTMEEKNAFAAYSSGHYRQAVKLYRSVCAARPGDHFAAHNLGLALYQSGDKDAACTEWTKLKEIDWHTADLLIRKCCRGK